MDKVRTIVLETPGMDVLSRKIVGCFIMAADKYFGLAPAALRRLPIGSTFPNEGNRFREQTNLP